MKHSEIEGIQQGQETTLKQLMRHVVETKQVSIEPDRFAKTYFHWIDNLRDWCISRQLWFGHRIPVWYRGEEIYCGVEVPEGEGWTQDEDTLDTWFSSGLWTFSTLGWPEQTPDLKTFHPTSMMMPGYEILFFWVARMVLMSGYHLGQIPFRQTWIHGIVRDKDGRKFSKSLNNGIDPLDMIEKYGTDALRFALVHGTALGNDVLFDEQKVKGMKHFGNKLWNISRYILMNVDSITTELPKAITEADTTLLDKLAQTKTEINQQMPEMRLQLVAEMLYQFIWHDLADVYIEQSKGQLNDPGQKENTQAILSYTLGEVLKMLHPFMPFVTEAIWSNLNQDKLLVISNWPKQ